MCPAVFMLGTYCEIEFKQSKNKLTSRPVAYEAGGGRPPPGLKNSGQTLFSGQAQVAQKSWKIKNISIQ